ncbi:MAG: NAD(P)H-hydrate dehydratase [Pseudomonadota bacterium]
MRVVDIQEMRDLEAKVITNYGLEKSLIVENAGIQGAEFIEMKFLLSDPAAASKRHSEILFMIGQGNNGAEGLAIARHLVIRGHHVHCFVLYPEDSCAPELKKQLMLARNYQMKISQINSPDQVSAYFTQTQESFFVVDAILGTGLRLPLSNYLYEVINLVNAYADLVVAIDLPSGVDANNGVISSVGIKADYSLAIAYPKTGQYNYLGMRHSGEVHVLNVGHPLSFQEEGDKHLINVETVARHYRTRDKWGHKNTFGHVLLIGGSPGMTGALIMAATSALKVGAGLVTAATWSENYMELVARATPELITGVIPLSKSRAHSVLRTLDSYDAIVVGPGLGRSPLVRDVVVEVLNHFYGPVILDADAINVLSLENDLSLFQMRKGLTIFTPHMGEFSRLIGEDIDQVLRNPLGQIQNFVDKVNGVLIMKGACTYLALPNGKIFLNYAPNDGMATAGSGDVLAGVLGGLIGQVAHQKDQTGLFTENEQSYQALALGILAHSLSGKFSSEKMGTRSTTALSLIESLSAAFAEIERVSRIQNHHNPPFLFEEVFHSQEQL